MFQLDQRESRSVVGQQSRYGGQVWVYTRASPPRPHGVGLRRFDPQHSPARREKAAGCALGGGGGGGGGGGWRLFVRGKYRGFLTMPPLQPAVLMFVLALVKAAAA